MKKTNQKTWLNSQEVADLLGYNREHVVRICLSWEKFGVKTYRASKRHLLFKTEEINRWLESTAIN